MLQLSFTSIVLALLVSCSSCAARQYPDQVPTMSDPAVVKLIIIMNGEESGYCTAWKLGEDLAMTAGHCCQKSTLEDKVNYTAAGPHAVPGSEMSVLYDDDDHDVCVLRGKILGAPIRIASMDPSPGQAVWTAGYPKTEYLISSGYWSGRDDEGWGKASVAVWGGASGSPLMNSAGEAVGVLVAYRPPMSNLGYMATVEWMRIAVDMARKQ
jgi:V8-like Glu-specific endopeptidase